MSLSFRFAATDDEALVLRFIRNLAEYEKRLDQVVASETLRKLAEDTP